MRRLLQTVTFFVLVVVAILLLGRPAIGENSGHHRDRAYAHCPYDESNAAPASPTPA